jgi:hypothetical protein
VEDLFLMKHLAANESGIDDVDDGIFEFAGGSDVEC